MDAVRVLEGVTNADFDIPTETFTIDLESGADPAPVLGAIKALGYTPKVLDNAPEKKDQIARLESPSSRALRDALRRARSRGVALIIDFGGPFCHLCRKFEETALKDQRVIKMLAGVEFLRIDTEADPDAAKDLSVHGVPDIWALDGDGTVLARHNGYMTPTEFVEFLSEVLE